MADGGSSGTQRAARMVARRPAIRPRAVTPPRSAEGARPASTTAHKLPPVRTPAPRRHVEGAAAERREAERPVLLLVADASDQFDIALRHESASAIATAQRATEREARRLPRSVLVAAAIAASIVVVIVAALVTSRVTAEPTFTPMPSTAVTTATAITTAPKTTAVPVAPASDVASPSIPVVDVKSLPPARSR